MTLPIIHYDYEFSPVGQKTKLFLEAAGVPYQRVDQPIALPRPDLEALGITYRRIPVLAVGKDIYLDSDRVVTEIQSKLSSHGRPVPSTIHDKAWQAWSFESFNAILQLIPAGLLSDDFKKDRSTVFPIVVRPDFESLRPSGLAELRSRMGFVEETLLKSGPGPFVGGSETISAVDIHVAWPLRWALFGLGAKDEEGVGRDEFPRVWKLLDSLPEFKGETISADTAREAILGSSYYDTQEPRVAKGDPLGYPAGTLVGVESMDSKPGSHPQNGKLVGSTRDEVVLELDNGLRLHFPRNGYVVRKV